MKHNDNLLKKIVALPVCVRRNQAGCNFSLTISYFRTLSGSTQNLKALSPYQDAKILRPLTVM